ncbi:methyltransferase type 12 [Mycobacterium triplex]|uniref:Methyltransferase type 12 n=1 Tax=Mycobacterium triplex TaxID=47839 RepID=A0A024K0W9_9MYCO|nr:class I SAM-dependent methyltransferase [Mycobacterium triplex]ORX01504.1 methyltransferase type 12 [Mycobacterium triplex]CDO89695.1 O-methyltransferase [Mycobacterium triplex]
MEELLLGCVDQDEQLRDALNRRFYTQTVVKGEITLSAVPGLIDEYVSMCAGIVTAVGRTFDDDELAHLREILETQLAEAYSRSTRSRIVIAYQGQAGSLMRFHVKATWSTVESAYEDWLSHREPPLFGTEPDARVWDLANEAGDPAASRVLEIGAGTGRNALPLARRGHPIDVVEMTEKFGDLIRAEAQREDLDVRVIVRDVFAAADELRCDYQLIVLSEVVSDFRSTRQLRGLFELAAERLTPGGRLVFNVFLPRGNYTPDDAAREFGHQVYTTIFTRHEMASAAAGLPLELVADDSVYDYEKAHLPEGVWPQTSWYADWVSGLDVFTIDRDARPIEMRWLVYQKTT